MSKRPWFRLWVNDWLSSTRLTLLEPVEELAFFRLLLHMWNAPDCTLPDDDRVLARLSRADEIYCQGCGEAPHEQTKQLLANVKQLLSKCEAKPGFLTCDRLLQEWKRAEEISTVRAESGKQKGRPKKADPEKPNNPDDIKPKQKLRKKRSKRNANAPYSDPDPESDPDLNTNTDTGARFAFMLPDDSGRGRKPLDKFPKLYASEPERQRIKETFIKRGLRREFWDVPFARVQTWFTDSDTGRKEYPKSSDHTARILAFGLKEALGEQKSADDAAAAANRVNGFHKPAEQSRPKPPVSPGASQVPPPNERVARLEQLPAEVQAKLKEFRS